MALFFEVTLEERRADRVVAIVRLESEGEPVALEGVAVELLDRGRDRLSSRVLLPIAGELAQSVAVRVELRAFDEIPVGAFIEATAWWEADQRRVVCPTDTSTELEAHVHGRGAIPLAGEDGEFLSLTPAQWRRLAGRFPWLVSLHDAVASPGGVAPGATEGGEDALGETLEETLEGLGLEGDEAEWLKELLGDEE